MQILNSVLNFFIPSAHADTTVAAAPAQAPQGGFSFLAMMAVLVFFMYFILWRPQSKRAKEHRDLINSIAKGDEVMTAGGILGTVSKITDQYIILSLNENTEITVQKSSVTNVLPKGTLKAI